MPNIINEQKSVPFNSIDIPTPENARTLMQGIDELAAQIKEHGLLQSLTVTNGGLGDKPYRLVAGFRRAAALKLLKWGSQDVPVILVPAEGRAIKNLVENVGREDLSAADLAQRLHDLSTGEYPREKDEIAIKYAVKELAEKTGLSGSHVTNLIRAHINLAPEVRKAWVKEEIPQNVIFKAAAMTVKETKDVELRGEDGKKLKDAEGNVKTKPVTTTVPDDKKQSAFLAKWEAQKAREEELLKAKKSGKKLSETEDEAGGESEEGDVPLPGRPSKKKLMEFIAAAKEKLKESEEGTLEQARLKGKMEGVQWAAGERPALAARG